MYPRGFYPGARAPAGLPLGLDLPRYLDRVGIPGATPLGEFGLDGKASAPVAYGRLKSPTLLVPPSTLPVMALNRASRVRPGPARWAGLRA